MSEQIDRHLVLGALRMAIGMRRPKAGLVHHTDRGTNASQNSTAYRFNTGASSVCF
jgi:hypothetical protein